MGVHKLTANPAGTHKVQQWLENAGVDVIEVHKFGHFVKARALVSQWESLLKTKFAEVASDDFKAIRAIEDVHVDDAVADALTGVFKSTQLPARRPVRPKISSQKPALSPVTPAGLNSFYHISGTGSSSTSQSVFETGQYVSPSDLAS